MSTDDLSSIEEQLRRLIAEVARLADKMERPLPTLLTKQRAAAELGVKRGKLNQLISDGKLLAVQLDEGRKSLRIPRTEFLRFVQQLVPPKGSSSRPRRRRAPSTGASPKEMAAALRAALRQRKR
jgi:excisionase family DNA binding protein